MVALFLPRQKRACVCILYFCIVQNMWAHCCSGCYDATYTRTELYTRRWWGGGRSITRLAGSFWQTYYPITCVCVRVCGVYFPGSASVWSWEDINWLQLTRWTTQQSLSPALCLLSAPAFYPPLCVCISAMIPGPRKMLLPAWGSRCCLLCR